MSKIALIVVNLVPDASEILNSQIAREVLAESQIPWCAKIEKVEIKNEADELTQQIKG